MILSGEAEVWQESNSGRREQLRRLGVGEFFGYRHRSADVVAAASLTCLVLSPHRRPSSLAGAGSPPGRCPARRAGGPAPAAGTARAGQGVVCCDVSGQVKRKVEALSAYRSQFPLEPDMFPEFLLREMFGREYFVASAAGRAAHLDEMPRGPAPEPALSCGAQPVAKDARHDDHPAHETTRRPLRRGSRHDHGP